MEIKDLPILIINDEKFIPDQNSAFFEPYSRMDLIRVIAEKENIKKNTDITVKIISRGKTRYVFSIGTKEIFNNTYAFGGTHGISVLPFLLGERALGWSINSKCIISLPCASSCWAREKISIARKEPMESR